MVSYVRSGDIVLLNPRGILIITEPQRKRACWHAKGQCRSYMELWVSVYKIQITVHTESKALKFAPNNTAWKHSPGRTAAIPLWMNDKWTKDNWLFSGFQLLERTIHHDHNFCECNFLRMIKQPASDRRFGFSLQDVGVCFFRLQLRVSLVRVTPENIHIQTYLAWLNRKNANSSLLLDGKSIWY